VTAATLPTSPEAARALGLKLRAARELKALTPEDISQAEKIPTGMVNALERGDYSNMGASVYVRGFIRSYARAVDLDLSLLNDDMEALGFVRQPDLVASQGERVERTGLSEQWMKFASYLVGSVIMMSAMYFVTQADRFVLSGRSAAPDAVTPLPRSVVESLPVTEAVLPPADPATSVLAIDQASPSAITPIAPPAGQNALAIPVPPLVQTELNPLESQTFETPIAAAMGGLPNLRPQTARFEIKVKQAVWTKVSDASGRILVNDNLAKGSQRSFEGQPPFTVLVGNAADAEVLIAGNLVDFSSFVKGNVARFKVSEQSGALTLVSNAAAQPQQ
jgi:cytoskeleton protein RodZ